MTASCHIAVTSTPGLPKNVSTQKSASCRNAIASKYPRPPYEDVDPMVAAEMLRWVSNNDDVVRERQYDHIRRVSGKVE